MATSLILASASPRRQQLLRAAGFVPEVVPAQLEERIGPEEPAAQAAERLARAKAREVLAGHPEALVLAADTLVVLNGAVLGKPRSVVEAEAMLARLSGRSHEVITGVALLDAEKEDVFHVGTLVEFRPLSPDEIGAYVRSGEPMDKAGAYGIQGGAAGFVRGIQGSYTNVVGLPLAEVVERLRMRIQ